MLKLDGKEINIGSFPDGTMLLKEKVIIDRTAKIEWYYENDREFVALIFLTKHLRAHEVSDVHLFMPYIPNARQDRVKTNEDVFTLKYFAEVINDLAFDSVTVLDPHSSVSEALISRIVIKNPKEYVQAVLTRIQQDEGETPLMFYPDEGAGKRYAEMMGLPYIFGIKKRDWKTGEIRGLDVAGEIEHVQGSNVLVVDDICSKGGTFYFSARKLKALGAKNIYLYITHCENTILRGELLDSGLFTRIFTTNSIFTKEHSRIEVFDCGGVANE